MTPLATHISVFLRQRLPIERGASERTCDTYALALRLFLEFAAKRPLPVICASLQSVPLCASLNAGSHLLWHKSNASWRFRLSAPTRV